MHFRAIILLLVTLTVPMTAKAKEPHTPKFSIFENTLIYDTEIAELGDDAEITGEDVDTMLEQLRANPQIKTLQLNSDGGKIWPSEEMARIVIDFDLDTLVAGECFSACVTIFLAGKSRKMTLGSKIGFHQSTWRAPAIERYYNKWHKTDGWDTPFVFSEWLYHDTQTEVYESLTYMVERGVDAAFAIKTKGIPNDRRWYPSRFELIQGGVLRD